MKKNICNISYHPISNVRHGDFICQMYTGTDRIYELKLTESFVISKLLW